MDRPARTRSKFDSGQLWTYALKILGERARSSAEVRRKLNERAMVPEDVDTAMAKLKEYGFIDDRRFAEALASARLGNQGFGKQRALRDLRQHRVAPGLAEQAVDRVYDGSDETALIEDFIRRKYRKAAREHLFEADKDVASAFRRLRLAGFQSGNIVRVLKRFAANPELLDAMESD